MRPLAETGIGILPFARPRDLIGVPLEMLNAKHRPGTRPNGDPVINVAFTFRRLNGDQVVIDGDGYEIPDTFVCTQEAGEARDQYVTYFEAERESIGPVEYIQLEGRNGLNGAYVLAPYQPPIDADYREPQPAQYAPQRAIPAATTQPAAQTVSRGAGRAQTRATAAQVSRIDRSQTAAAQAGPDLPF